MQNPWPYLKQLAHTFQAQSRFLPVQAYRLRLSSSLFNIFDEEFGVIAKTGYFIVGMTSLEVNVYTADLWKMLLQRVKESRSYHQFTFFCHLLLYPVQQPLSRQRVHCLV